MRKFLSVLSVTLIATAANAQTLPVNPIPGPYQVMPLQIQMAPNTAPVGTFVPTPMPLSVPYWLQSNPAVPAQATPQNAENATPEFSQSTVGKAFQLRFFPGRGWLPVDENGEVAEFYGSTNQRGGMSAQMGAAQNGQIFGVQNGPFGWQGGAPYGGGFGPFGYGAPAYPNFGPWGGY